MTTTTATVSELKADVFSLASALAGSTLETVQALKKWCERNLSELPTSLDLRAKKGWVLLAKCLQSYSYQMEVERRQDEALADWEEGEEVETETQEVEITIEANDLASQTLEEAIALLPESAPAAAVQLSPGVFPLVCPVPSAQTEQELMDTAIALAQQGITLEAHARIEFRLDRVLSRALKLQNREFNGRMSANALRRRFASLGLR